MKSSDSPVVTAAVWLGIAIVGGIALLIVLSLLLALVGAAIGITAAIVGLALKVLPYVVAGALLWAGYQYVADDDPTAVADGSGTAARRTERAAADGGDPVETLRRRYVEGEIGDDEFERRMERLMGSTDRERNGGTADVTATERRRELLDDR